jgi:hypothetical protein
MAPSLKDFYLKTFKLPNSGGTFQSPAPIVQGTENPMPQATWGNGAPVYQNPLQTGGGVTPTKPVFTGTPTPPVTTSVAPTTPPARSKYINPETGKYFTPEEYANYVALKIPASKGTGDIPQYAGDAMTKPDESSTALTARATNLSNTRNDIATGTTDPYKVGAQSGIAYSPAELAAIEKAYAGVYDPALNDVFARLKTREKEEQRKQDREDKIFATNESIRAWRATTGSKSGTDDDFFTNANLKTGAARANLTIDEFKQLDSDIKNYFVSRPKVYDPVSGKSSYVDDNMTELMTEIEDGALTAEEGAQEIMDGDLPEAVKLYLIGQLPLTPEKKDGWFKKIMQGIGEFFS